ncbi:MAG: reprolysin-like metallopeptidase [Planctomycetota bacterium]
MPDTLRITTPSGSMLARIESFSKRRKGTPVTLRGVMVGPDLLPLDTGSFQLTTDGENALGAMWTSEGTFELRLVDAELVAIPPMGERFRCRCELGAHNHASHLVLAQPQRLLTEPLTATAGSANTINNSGPPCFSYDSKTITVLIPITPSVFENVVEPLGGLGLYSEAAIELVNTNFINTLNESRVVIAEAYVDPDLEFDSGPIPPTSDLFLTNLAAGAPGEMARAKRDETCADLVAAIASITGAGGQAFIGVNGPGNGFSVTTPGFIFTFNALAHEIGHNLGANHEPGLGGPTFLPEARGWIFEDAISGNPTATTMGISTFNRIPQYSNPDVLRDGVATGVAGLADVENALQTTVPIASVYRERLTTPAELDCNNDGVFDAQQIAQQPAIDMNFDGLIDSCQIASDPSFDCDGNGLLDRSELIGQVAIDLGVAEIPPGGTVDFDIPPLTLPTSNGSATLLLTIGAEFDSAVFPDRFVQVSASNPPFDVPLPLLAQFPASGSCELGAQNLQVINSNLYGRLRDDADTGEIAFLRVSVSPDVPNPTSCGTPISVSARLFVRTPIGFINPASLDADADGILDVCDCPADFDGNGSADSSDVSAFIAAVNDLNITTDIDGSGIVDFFDLIDFLSLVDAGCS